MQNRLFIKVYVNAELHDQVHELARLLGTSAGGLVREYLTEEIHLERRLLEARANEAQRLALLQESLTAKSGQADWLGSVKGRTRGGAHGPAGARRPPTTGKRLRKAVKRSGRASRAG